MPAKQSGFEEGLAPKGLDVIRLIGRGSMGGVYLARDARLKRLVAVKVLREELAKDTVSRQRFEREAQAAARISHRNVTQVFDIGRLENDVPYIVMEYVKGRNLADLIASEGPLTVARTTELLLQIVAALAAAHAKHVIHRDVEPANVILEHETGRAVLTDFGLAGIQETGSEAVVTLTRTGELIGDPRYMSPEQHRGEPLTEQSDIYSVGVIGYELLTKHSPFGGDVPANEATRHLRRVPLTLSEIRADIPQWLSDLLKSCLAKRAEHRPGIDKLAAVLSGDIAEESSDDAASLGTLPRFLAELKKRRVYQAAAAYLTIVVIVLQTLDVIIPNLPLPPWVFTALVAMSLGAFPMVIVLAWIYDYRQGRITKTADELPSRANWVTTTMQTIGLGISILIAASVAWWILS